jgi:hypothetical protein
MFEPENDIERLLMRASAEPAERPAFARALMDGQTGGRLLDAMPLDGSSLAVTLRTGIPITAGKSGFLQKLFR